MRSDSGRGVERPTTAKETMEDTALQISFRHFHGEIESISTGIENVIRLLIKSVLHKSQLLLSEKRMCVDGGGKREEGGGRREEGGRGRGRREEEGGDKSISLSQIKVSTHTFPDTQSPAEHSDRGVPQSSRDPFDAPKSKWWTHSNDHGGHTAMTMVDTQQ